MLDTYYKYTVILSSGARQSVRARDHEEAVEIAYATYGERRVKRAFGADPGDRCIEFDAEDFCANLEGGWA